MDTGLLSNCFLKVYCAAVAEAALGALEVVKALYVVEVRQA